MELEILNIRLSNNIEKTTLKEQYLLFTALNDILSSKEKPKKFIQQNGLKSSNLVKDFWDYPFWYKKFVDEFNDSYYSPTLEEVKSAIAILKRMGRTVNWENLQKIKGKWLEAKKRPNGKNLLHLDVTYLHQERNCNDRATYT